MREKLKKMMWGEPTGEYIPNTIAEYAIMRNIFETMPENSVAESVTFTGLRNGKRNTEVQASLYDAMMAEIMGEKDARLRKYLRKHEIRSDGHPVRKEKRKAYMKEKCYQCSPWNGWDIVRNVRIAEKIRTDAEDWKLEQDAIAEDAEWEKFNAELLEYDRQLREEAEAEQRKMREYRKMRELNEWLKYA